MKQTSMRDFFLPQKRDGDINELSNNENNLKKVKENSSVECKFLNLKGLEAISDLKNRETEILNYEKKRLILQQQLYASRSMVIRNEMGQHETPMNLAQKIVRVSFDYLSESAQSSVRFLDPSAGTGTFFSALLQCGIFPSSNLNVELDSDIFNGTKNLWKDFIEIKNNDFLQLQFPSKKFNLIICNPPYSRHHHLSIVQKHNLNNLAKECDLDISKLAGLHCYFVASLFKWQTADGISAWILPSEFISVTYGHALRSWLTSKVTLLRFHYFDADNNIFDDAMVTTSVIWVRNQPSPINHSVIITKGDLLTPSSSISIPATTMCGSPKWNNFFFSPIINNNNLNTRTKKIGQFFNVKRGIATGNNNYFVNSLKFWKQSGISHNFLQPLIPPPKNLNNNIEINSSENGDPTIANLTYVFKCNVMKDGLNNYPNVLKYITDGEREKIHLTYLCANRTPWYKVEQRDPPEIVITYMGRITGEKTAPFKFIRNRSHAIALNSYLMLYLKEDFDNIEYLWDCLRTLDSNTLVSIGRVYSGGLYKIEPKELLDVTF